MATSGSKTMNSFRSFSDTNDNNKNTRKRTKDSSIDLQHAGKTKQNQLNGDEHAPLSITSSSVFLFDDELRENWFVYVRVHADSKEIVKICDGEMTQTSNQY